MTAGKAISQRLKLSDIIPNPKNPNITDPETMRKIRNNIARTGMVPPLIVRPAKKGVLKPPFILLDGYHRKTIIEELGWEEIDCSIWDVTEREGDVALATLNRLHGTDDLKLRAQLVHDLVEVIPIDQLGDMLPETPTEIDDLLRITQIDLDALDRAQNETAAKNDAETARPFTVLLFPQQEAVVRLALERVQADMGPDAKNKDGNALEMICADFLSGQGVLPESVGQN